MTFNDTYFEDEVRDGFFVPSEIKRAWAAELEVLSEVDKICKKHNIQYFADWGTLLAAVRHEGFIPWDDDLDIVMKRADYNRFMEIAKTELPEGFSAYNFRNHDNLWLFLGRVVGKQRICFEEEHLERFHQFPYIAGVDIFVLDYVSRDKEAEKARNELALRTIALADAIGEGVVQPDVMEAEISKLEQTCDIQLSRGLSALEMKRELYGLVELLFGWFKEEEADELTQLFPFGMKNGAFHFPKECYEHAIQLPYENTRIPVPIRYCEMLEKKYGDYMRLVRDAGGHDYPFFEAQKRQLQAVLDFEMPAYRFSTEQLQCERDDRGYKELLKKMFCRLQQECDGLRKAGLVLHVKQDENEQQRILTELGNMQQTAIDMGTLIDDIRGEGAQTVKRLEELCEEIYQYSIAITEGRNVSQECIDLQSKLAETGRTLQNEILECREVVFFINKAEYWKYAEWYWEKTAQEENTDIHIVPIPYFYKKYDGTSYREKLEADEIQKCVNRSLSKSGNKRCVDSTCISNYQNFDVQLHHPDQIIILNPCDEWNQATTVSEKFYSRNLKKYTEQLVYIQSFHMEEFTKNNDREYHNMQYYCTMPGVVVADRVYVQSENMKDLYVEKLTEFAGEDTKTVWERKIAVADSTKSVAGDNPDYDLQKTGTKKIAFFVQAGLTIQYGEEMLKKLQSVIGVFRDNQEKVKLIWIGDREHDVFLREYDHKLADKYDAIKDEFIREGWGGFFDRTDMDVAEIVTLCDAYYGSASHIALEFEVKKKPVMIMNVEVV